MFKDPLALQVLKELLERLVLKEDKAHKACKAHKVQLVLRERKGSRGFKAQSVPKDLQG